MSFRQNNKRRRPEHLKWQSFREANWELIERIGLPMVAVDTWDGFLDFLENAYMEWHDDPTRFTVDQLDSEKLELLRILVDKYLEAGFSAGGMTPAIVGGREAYLKLVRKHPDKFHALDVALANEVNEEENEAKA